MGVKLWTIKYLEWVKREVHFEQMAQEATLLGLPARGGACSSTDRAAWMVRWQNREVGAA
jgi:hypothetical protein